MRFITPFLLATLSVSAAIIKDVRTAIASNDFSTGARLIQAYRSSNGVTPEMLEALSWMARGELAAKNYDQAEKYSEETYQLSTAELKKRPLDQEKNLPIALGAAIEVGANVLAARHQRTEAVIYLQDQLNLYRTTSINARIQKNINLLSLEGKPA